MSTKLSTKESRIGPLLAFKIDSGPARPARKESRVGLLAQRLRSGLGRALRRVILCRPSPSRRDEILLDTSVLIRSDRLHDASKLLDRYYRVMLGDAAYLNLLGVTTELRGDRWTAMRLYHIALTIDQTYKPARANLYRAAADENGTSSRRAMDLGDATIRAHRFVSNAHAN